MRTLNKASPSFIILFMGWICSYSATISKLLLLPTGLNSSMLYMSVELLIYSLVVSDKIKTCDPTDRQQTFKAQFDCRMLVTWYTSFQHCHITLLSWW